MLDLCCLSSTASPRWWFAVRRRTASPSRWPRTAKAPSALGRSSAPAGLLCSEGTHFNSGGDIVPWERTGFRTRPGAPRPWSGSSRTSAPSQLSFSPLTPTPKERS
jgi:hypothetical protein